MNPWLSSKGSGAARVAGRIAAVFSLSPQEGDAYHTVMRRTGAKSPRHGSSRICRRCGRRGCRRCRAACAFARRWAWRATCVDGSLGADPHRAPLAARRRHPDLCASRCSATSAATTPTASATFTAAAMPPGWARVGLDAGRPRRPSSARRGATPRCVVGGDAPVSGAAAYVCYAAWSSRPPRWPVRRPGRRAPCRRRAIGSWSCRSTTCHATRMLALARRRIVDLSWPRAQAAGSTP